MNQEIVKQRERDRELGARLIAILREIHKDCFDVSINENNRKIDDPVLEDFYSKHILDVQDIKELFSVGEVKAKKIMQTAPHFRVGYKYMCTRKDLYEATMSNKLKI